ncbi:Zn-dependent protease (includes SpoIVFB) [Cohnella sp. OV330]|uniref:site-2 protease family protein n=1 Tax=Cohnella sp. OV330 TaxID=1855288 RepID=UPI0008EE5AD2|nr:site-2 protease family protein [Cohnella sp. OV330]SFB35084.1 Zn-dependent protease (includes SpoIVFB) [Cohnella sp. OV330]
MSFFWFPLNELPFVLLTMLVAFTVHEFAHAWTAYKLGDPTAYEQGRVTLNPMAHLDLFGILFLLVAGFGWAKPVPVRRSRFKRPRLMSIAVTAAGPISNLVLAFLGLFIYLLLVKVGALDQFATRETVWTFFSYFVPINVMLFLFNLIPLPPLDGYRIVEEFAPLRLRLKMMQFEQWGMFLFLLFVFLPPLKAVTLTPLFSLGRPIIDGMTDAFVSLLQITSPFLPV